MDAALREFLAGHREYASLQFFGYSGGGVIATLRQRIFRRRRALTPSPPLSTSIAAVQQGYARLEDSINPSLEPTLSPAIAQLRVVGDADDTVPASLVEPFVVLQHDAEVRNVPQSTHYCCWGSVWKDTVLKQR